MAMFSIIVPVYNVAAYLRSCLASLVDQTESSWEAICVDDGSTDGSAEILDEFAARDSRIRVIHQSNSGVSAARNAALDIASGDWIGFLDGDDTYHPQLLQVVSEAIAENEPLDAVGYGAVYVDENGEIVGRLGKGVPLSRGIKLCSEVLGDGRGPYSRFVWSVWDKFFRRERIVELNLRFEIGMKLSEDSLFAQLYLAQSNRIALLPDFDGYRYLMRVGSATHSATKITEDHFRRERVLYSLYRRIGGAGLLNRLRSDLAGAPRLGRFDGAGARQKAVELLLRSEDFNGWILSFLILHGTIKSRIFALAYKVSPRPLRRKLLSYV